MLLRAFACLEMKKRKEKKGHPRSRPLSSLLSAPLLQNSGAGKRLISVSCAVHGAVWKVILYSQVAEQTAAREEGGRGAGRRRRKGKDITREEGRDERRGEARK